MNDDIIEAQPDGNFKAYLNYVDPTYTAEEAHELYYGDELYARLSSIKQTFDPREVFWHPQAIRAAGNGYGYGYNR